MVTGNVKQFAIVENPADIITKKRLKLKIKLLSDRILRLYICGNTETAASAKYSPRLHPPLNTKGSFLDLISFGMPLADWWRMLRRRQTMGLMTISPRRPSSVAWLAAVIFYGAVVASGIAKTGIAKPNVTSETEEQAMQGTKMTWKLNKK